LANCITKLFREHALRLRMGLSGQHASARFAWSLIAEQLDRILADSHSDAFQLFGASFPLRERDRSAFSHRLGS
jgi:hypothetical protein